MKKVFYLNFITKNKYLDTSIYKIIYYDTNKGLSYMNQIKATITNIKKHQNISALSFDALGFHMSMVALELNEKLQVGTHVTIKAKATNISLAKEIEHQISISNQLHGEVYEIDNGVILCSVKIKIKDTILESIITQNSASKMDIKVGDKIIALIKATDISVAQIVGENG